MDLNLRSNYFFVDLETSGNDPDRNGVISCAVVVTDFNFNVIDTFCRLVKPPMLSRLTWSTDAEAVHKIPFNKVWYEGTPNDQFCFELLSWLNPYRPIYGHMPFVCHASKSGKVKLNAMKKPMGTYEIWPRFDWHFLERCFRKAEYQDRTQMVYTFWKVFNMDESFISTVQMGREAGYKKNSLSVWAERIRFPLNHHDAMSDVLCCLEVFKYITERNRQNVGF